MQPGYFTSAEATVKAKRGVMVFTTDENVFTPVLSFGITHDRGCNNSCRSYTCRSGYVFCADDREVVLLADHWCPVTAILLDIGTSILLTGRYNTIYLSVEFRSLYEKQENTLHL